MSWTWARATRKGTSHIASDTPCQDFSRCLLLGRQRSVLAAVVSDGAGSATYSRAGAALTCRAVIDGARAHFDKHDGLPDDELVWTWIDDARDRISHAASRCNSTARQFAATLVCVLVLEGSCLVLHVGDGGAALKNEDGWQVPSWPESGEFASTTYFVTDDPVPRLRITSLSWSPEAVAVFSDGIERLVLNFAEKLPHAPFFETMIKPVLTGAPGRNEALSIALGAYLDSEQVNSRTDDDKSLVLAARVR